MEKEGLLKKVLESQKAALEEIDRLFEATRPEVVFGKPITVGEAQVFTASETLTVLGVGWGVGSGEANPQAAEESPAGATGTGGGGGGGGASFGRPVAVIRVDSEGVTVEPVVDVTKIALAAFTALGSMFLMFAKMAKKAR